METPPALPVGCVHPALAGAVLGGPRRKAWRSQDEHNTLLLVGAAAIADDGTRFATAICSCQPRYHTIGSALPVRRRPSGEFEGPTPLGSRVACEIVPIRRDAAACANCCMPEHSR